MSKNLLFRNGEENGKVIRNPHADPDYHQKLNTSRGSLLAHACQVWSTSVSAFVSYPVYRMIVRMTERQNDHMLPSLANKHIHNLRLVGGGKNTRGTDRQRLVLFWDCLSFKSTLDQFMLK